MRKMRRLYNRFGSIDNDITQAELDVQNAGQAFNAAVVAATVPTGACRTPPPAQAPLPPIACDPGLGTAMADAQKRLASAGQRLADLQRQKAQQATSESERAAATEKAAKAEQAVAQTQATAAQTQQVAQQAQQARASGDASAAQQAVAAAKETTRAAESAVRTAQSAAGQSWFQTAPMEQKLALAGVVFGALLILIFALKM